MIDGYRFFCYSNERNEPPHMHVRKGGNGTKIWLATLEFAYSYGFAGQELTRIRRVTRSHLNELFDLWDEHFAG